MRKFITSSVFILLFILFSGSVFAGDVSDCDEVRGQKGLYGLCVAYWQANPKHKEKFRTKFKEKSGGMEIPGVDPVVQEDPDAQGDDGETNPVVCPCWANGENFYPVDFDWIPGPGGGYVDGTAMRAFYEFDMVQFVAEPNFCAYGNQLAGFNTFVALSTTDKEDAVCVADMVEMIARDF